VGGAIVLKNKTDSKNGPVGYVNFTTFS
jgi:hypothetical protein